MRQKVRIPKRIILGPNWILSVVQLPTARYAEEAEEDHLPKDERSAGCWDRETLSIFLDKSLSVDRKWRALRHEIGHALTDIALEEIGGI